MKKPETLLTEIVLIVYIYIYMVYYMISFTKKEIVVSYTKHKASFARHIEDYIDVRTSFLPKRFPRCVIMGATQERVPFIKQD